MAHLFVIAVLVSLSLAGGGAVSGALAADADPQTAESVRTLADGMVPLGIAPWARLVVILSIHVSIAVAAWSGVHLCVRAIDRRGTVGAVRWSSRIIACARAAALGWHLVSVFVLGLLGLVRTLTGDLVLVDELIASIPAFAVLLWTYRLAHPIERRVRDAMLIRTLDEGRPVYAFPRPWRYVLGAARNSLAIMFVPLVLILGWSELLDLFLARMTWPAEPAFIANETVRAAAPAVARLAGSVAIFALVPPVMTRVWDTVPIPVGELRSDLELLARTHKIRLRRFLIWRTGGAMLNGAVIGLVPWLRYIVLTDALLESLTEPEVEAVAAHEVAHVRKHHMVWLALAVLGSALLVGEGAALMLMRMEWPESLAAWTSAGFSLVAVVLVLGIVSRRFEWQADAFAARHLSEHGLGESAGRGTITEEGARAMSSALGRVARLNGMPEKRFTWRHGSIRTRRRRLAALVGKKADRLPIDRRVRALKVVTLLGFAAGLWLLVAGFAGVWPYTGL
jgi:STE24 endopeptidase